MTEQLNIQVMDALVKANHVRTARAIDKKAIAQGQLDAATILRTMPKHWSSATLAQLLVCLPRIGRSKAQKWCSLSSPPLNLDRRLDLMSPRQRAVMASQVDAYTLRRDNVRRDLEDQL